MEKPFYVWGEDALLSWPGAESALIRERDAFMARVLAAVAAGSTCNAPAFLAEEVRAAGLVLCGAVLGIPAAQAAGDRPSRWGGGRGD